MGAGGRLWGLLSSVWWLWVPRASLAACIDPGGSSPLSAHRYWLPRNPPLPAVAAILFSLWQDVELDWRRYGSWPFLVVMIGG